MAAAEAEAEALPGSEPNSILEKWSPAATALAAAAPACAWIKT